MKNNFYNFKLLLMLFVLGLAACANQPTTSAPGSTPEVAPSNDVIAEGRLKPVRAVSLSFQQFGIVEEVSVKIGDPVGEGDLLARLANADQAEAQLAAARLALVEAQQEMDSLTRTGASNLASTWTAYMDAQAVRADAEREWEDLNVEDIDERIDDARAELQDRAADLEEAQDEFERYSDLDEDNASRQSAEDELETTQEDYNEALRSLEEVTRERDTVRAALDAALAAEAELRHQYELSSEGANADQLALARARLENAQAQVSAAEDLLTHYLLTAPFDGVIVDVSVEVGEQLAAGSRAVGVADSSSWVVETTDVTELEVVDLAVGQPVRFTADALPDVTMSGTVSEISQSSLVQGGDVIYTVRIQAEQVDPRVLWGMTVEVVFESLGRN